ncbi:discoidin domain-containing protein [Streptomyces physcomitrii]|uniref:Discoidin domain-containing protein n=1 Tax=Streptomyces physcomitrii TaxID=2724184 RepID=A0ABX1H767_9ACTN|nr:discoidin domain-containing protein [Streptomyces physcomitrii]NKI42856.1 discoidin domain-containing protein [Streptomyces physcomitrii]
MGPTSLSLGRRRLLQALGASGAAAVLATGSPAAAATARPTAAKGPAEDDVAATYYRVLLRHTRWTETQWDPARGIYTDAFFGFAVVLGHAVLLTRGTYDEQLAGIDRATLKRRTLATLRHFAGSNRLTGGTQWGRTLFFDTTFQSYFVLAARLLWEELDATTRSRVDRIVREQAAYTHSLGSGDDPASGDWTPNGLEGGHVGDTKLEEMGLYAQTLAPALAWAPDDRRRSEWATAFGIWSRNEAGLPQADLANPARVDGVPVSRNTARNVYDTFLVENHGSFGPHYQAELWRTSGRNAAHFLAAGEPLPEVLTRQPNAGPLWHTLLGVMSDAGEPLMPMVNDREHLYGRDVLPLAFLAQVAGDRAAARAERELAARLEAYQAYPPEHRLAKFSGEPKYEPEARAELAISCLLHLWPRAGGRVTPLSREELFAAASGATDFGSGPGLVSHQSPAAWAGAVSKAGFVKFAWQPGHDDWLFRISGSTPMFLPSTKAEVTGRSVRTHTRLRDGFTGSATLLRLKNGFAGLTTLPTGAVVYAAAGPDTHGARLEVHNLTMPGVAGLDGRRTYRFAEGTAAVDAQDASGGPAGRVDEVVFDRATVRHLRILGVRPDPAYGYSLFAVEARDGAGGEDLARGHEATASSYAPGRGPELAVDGDGATRWAVSAADRPRADSWLAVDLGAARALDRVTLRWESAAGRAYRVQGSDDNEHWTDLASGPAPALRSTGGWLDVDGRAGLVQRGPRRPIAVYGDTIVLADGAEEAAGPLVVEGHCGVPAGELRALALRPAPAAEDERLRAALTDGHLSLFNLSAQAVRSRVTLAQEGRTREVYEGTQTVTRGGLSYEARLDAASALLLPPRFTLAPLSGRALPTGLRVRVVDAATLRLSGPGCRLRVTAQGQSEVAVVRPGRETEVTVHGARPYPTEDHALDRTVFPLAPLPSGMSEPGAAVDGDPGTAWRPGRGGRMVVDLGAARAVRRVEAEWSAGHAPTAQVEFSDDGVRYTRAGTLPGHGRLRRLHHSGSPRYVALRISGTPSEGTGLVRLSVY